MKKLYLVLCLLSSAVIFYSCGSSRKTASAYPPAGTVENVYVNKYKDLAVSEMYRTGVPASITLAQGIIESDYGRSTLAREANNHFGVKCHGDWTGPTIRHNDDRRNECFRKYRHVEESFRDHSDFLKNGRRYAFLFDLQVTDYKGWARGLKKAGYATNPDYANMLIRKIEEFHLDIYDRAMPGKKNTQPVYTAEIPEKSVRQKTDADYHTDETVSLPEPEVSCDNDFVITVKTSRIMENNGIPCIIAGEGESLESIEKEFDMFKWEVQKYNELGKKDAIYPGQILYFRPKHAKADIGKDTYVVKQGDTIYSISQAFGIWTKNIYKYNRMEPGEEPVPGQKLWLREMAPVK